MTTKTAKKAPKKAATKKTAKKAAAPAQTYNWDKLFNGQKHTLKKGVDFTSSERSLIVYFYNRAKKMGQKIQLRQIEGGMTVKALSRDEIKAIAKEKADAAKAKRKAG